MVSIFMVPYLTRLGGLAIHFICEKKVRRHKGCRPFTLVSLRPSPTDEADAVLAFKPSGVPAQRLRLSPE